MFYSFNGRYIGYSDLDIGKLIDKLKEASFIIVASYSCNFGLNEQKFYYLQSPCAISTKKIDEINEVGSHIEELDKESLEILFK